MKSTGLNNYKRIGFFVEKAYFQKLYTDETNAQFLERLEERLIRYTSQNGRNSGPSFVCKHLIGERQAVKAGVLTPEETQAFIDNQRMEDLFLSANYELTNKLSTNVDEEKLEVYLHSVFALKVMTEAITKQLDIVYISVQKNLYDYLSYHIFHSLRSLGVEVRMWVMTERNDYTGATGRYNVSATSSRNFNEEEEEGESFTEAVADDRVYNPNGFVIPSYAPTILDEEEEEPEPTKPESAPIEEEELEEEETTLEEGVEYIGEIANIVRDKGFAFIKRSPANIFLYYGNMIDREDFYDLEIGSQVIYEIQETTGGRIQAIKVYPL